VERRHLASLGAAALLLLCGIVQLVLFFTSDPDLLELSLEETAATVEVKEPEIPLRIALFSPAGEESGAVDKALRARFQDQPGWKVLDRETQEEALNDFADISRRPKNEAEAIAAGKKLGVEAAFYAEVRTFRQTGEKAEVAFTWGVVKVLKGDKVAGGTAARTMNKGFFALDRYRARMDHTSALFRIFLWIVALLVLPAALAPVNELVLRWNTNAAAAGLLTAYAVLDFVLMLLLNGFRLITPFWGIAALVALAAGALYTMAVLNALSED
jgi:hypothetical protein